MTWILVISGLILGGFLFPRFLREGETSLVRSVRIGTPPSVVFNLISRIDLVPGWHRETHGISRLLGVPMLARWGEYSPARLRVKSRYQPDIQVGWLRDREFAYCEKDSKGLIYESVYHISRHDRECILAWEVRYRPRRQLDAFLNQPVIKIRTGNSMEKSLATIRRQAESASLAHATAMPMTPQLRPLDLQVAKAG